MQETLLVACNLIIRYINILSLLNVTSLHWSLLYNGALVGWTDGIKCWAICNIFMRPKCSKMGEVLLEMTKFGHF